MIHLYLMAEIPTRCPKTGKPVSTGLDSDMVIFASLPEIPIPVRCPACGSKHFWTRTTAWVAEKERGEVQIFQSSHRALRVRAPHEIVRKQVMQ